MVYQNICSLWGDVGLPFSVSPPGNPRPSSSFLTPLCPPRDEMVPALHHPISLTDRYLCCQEVREWERSWGEVYCLMLPPARHRCVGTSCIPPQLQGHRHPEQPLPLAPRSHWAPGSLCPPLPFRDQTELSSSSLCSQSH